MLIIIMDLVDGFVTQDSKIVKWVDKVFEVYFKNFNSSLKPYPTVIRIGSETILLAFRVKLKKEHAAERINIYNNVKVVYEKEGKETTMDKNGELKEYPNSELHLDLLFKLI